MAKKYISKALSVGLSLVMCAGMVVPAFAASFSDLNNAIQGGAGKDTVANSFTAADGSTRYGYGAGQDSSWEIEAWDEAGTRNVQLNADVTYQDGNTECINIGKNVNVTLNLNGQTVDGGYNEETGDEGNRNHIFTVQDGATLEINGGENSADTTNRGTITGGNSVYGGGKWGYGGAIYVYGGGTLVVNNADLTGNHAYNYGGAIAAKKDAVVMLNNTNVTGNTTNYYGGGISAEGSKLYVTGGYFIGNAAGQEGGAIYATGATVGLTDVVMNDNTAVENGGALRITKGSDAILDGITATGNTAGRYGGALNTYSSKVTMNNITMTGNRADMGSGGLYIGSTGDDTNVYFGENVNISGNTKGNGTRSNIQIEICDADGSTKPKDRVPTLPEPERYEGEYVGPSDFYVKGGVSWIWSYVDPVVTTPDDSDGTTPTPGGNGGRPSGSDASTPDDVPAAEPTTGIEDEAVPLAGLFTRADAIGYLWEQAGSPEAELSDFPDVPEEHQWAVAIGWAQDMGIALPDEDGNFRPDDLVLRSVDDLEVDPEGELQEFLNRYAVFAGVELDEGELFIELDGAADDVIMGEEAQEIFDLFFALLEEALADQAA